MLRISSYFVFTLKWDYVVEHASPPPVPPVPQGRNICPHTNVAWLARPELYGGCKNSWTVTSYDSLVRDRGESCTHQIFSMSHHKLICPYTFPHGYSFTKHKSMLQVTFISLDLILVFDHVKSIKARFSFLSYTILGWVEITGKS